VPLIKSGRTGYSVHQCGLKQDIPISVYITTDVPRKDYLVIQDALDYWNEEFNGDIFVLRGVAREHTMPVSYDIRISVVFLLGEDEKNNLGRMLPIIDYDRGCIKRTWITYVPHKLDGQEMRKKRVIAHELGHALGLDHLNIKGDIMTHITPKNIITIPKPTENQIRVLKDIYGLK
jgi:hypothetical protein